MTMYELPYGNTQQLNLDWFIKRWQEFYEEWQTTEAGIDGALDAEVERVEAAMSDLYAARDAAAASATAAAASATSASNDATIAANAATAAAASATLANTKATAAGLSEAAAALSASQAANDATAAATSASQASASASSATDSAQAAAASATAADSSADAAADSATAAAGSATAAAGSASNAADSATAAAASAASLVVDSAMSDSSTNPVQNKVINGELTELKTAITEIELVTPDLLTGNYIPVDSFIRHSNATTYTTTPNSVYMSTTKTNTWVGTSTPTNGLKNILKVGHKYRLHAKLDSYSSSAVYKAVIVRGTDTGADNKAATIEFADIGEAYVDFVATGYESYVTMFLSGTTSAKGSSVQYSDVWLKEILEKSAIDVLARNELDDIEPKNIFNKGFCPTFSVNKNTGVLDSADNVGNCASDYIEVEPNTKYLLNCNYYSSAGNKGIAYYDEDKTYLSGSLFAPSGTSQRYPFVFVTPTDTKYLRFSFWRNEADIYKVDTLFIGKYDEALEKKYGLSNDFNGEKLSLGSSIKVSTLNSFNPTTYGAPQGGDIYGNQLFGFSNNLENNFVYDLDTMSIQTVAYNGAEVDNHANVVSFGNAKYDSGDTYPMIYISSERGKYVGIFRIINSNGYEITEVTRINFPSEIPNEYANCVVDRENNRLCLIALLPSISQITRIYLYNLPNTFDAEISLEAVEYSVEHPNGFISSVDLNPKFTATSGTAIYTQDCFVFNNKLYRVNGSSGTGSLNVTNLNNGELLTYANISSTITGEPEIFAKYGERIIVVSTQGNIYSIVDT